MNNYPEIAQLTGADGVQEAIRLLRQGECVALPTETVYGLAADAAQNDAVARIFSAKGRPANHPLIVHIPSVAHVQRWADAGHALIDRLAEAFWPGPLTLILPARADLSSPATGGLPTIGLRVPAHPLFLQILTELDTGLAAPSANRYKQLSPTLPEQVVAQLNGRIAAVLDGGPCEHGLESTILDLSDGVPRVLRAGPISARAIADVLGQPVETPRQHNVAVPGNVRAHYRPTAPVTVLSREQLAARLAEPGLHDVGVLYYSEPAARALAALAGSGLTRYQLPDDAAGYGRVLYNRLYVLDEHAPDEILVEAPPPGEAWLAVNDRLSRAATQWLAPAV